MYKLTTVLLTGLVLLNITHKRKNFDSTIANVATCKVFKNVSMVVFLSDFDQIQVLNSKSKSMV
jgi:hypothetical protein